METILDFLDEMEEILDASRPVPFSNKVSVDRERLFDIIERIRLNLPTEIEKAQKIVYDYERIIGDARSKSEIIMDEARTEAANRADDHEVYKIAEQKAEEIIEKSKKEANEVRQNVMEYADEILAKAEATVREVMSSVNQGTRAIDDLFNNTLDIIYDNRQELREPRGNKK